MAMNLISGVEAEDPQSVFAAPFLAMIAAARGDEETLKRCARLVAGHAGGVADLRAASDLVAARIALERGEPAEALRQARPTLELQTVSGEIVVDAYFIALAASLVLADSEAIDELIAFVDALPPARATPLLRAGRAELAAERAHHSGDEEAMDRFDAEAVSLLRSVGARPLLAQALAGRARRCEAPEARAEAREIYEELRATRWLEQLDHVVSGSGVIATGS